jgi:hypothetical protein
MEGPIDYWSALPHVDFGEIINNAILEPGARQNALAAQKLQAQQMEAQKAQMVRQALAQTAVETARQAYLANPTTENLSRLNILDPGSFKAVKEAHDMLDADAQKQDLRDLSHLRGLLIAGQTDAAAEALQRRIDADKKAGQDTSDDEEMLATIKADPTKARGMVDAHLYGALGPEKYTAAFKAVGEEDRANAELPGKIADQAAGADLKTAQAAHARAQAATEGVKIVGADQSVVDVTGGGPAAPSAAPGLTDYVDKLVPTEKGATPDAKNPRSTATGDGQFINATWLDQVKTHRPDLAKGKTDAQILALRKDPELSREIVGTYAQDNAPRLEAAGMPINAATLAMAHKLGPEGAISVFHADAKAPLAKVLPAAVMVANPQLKGQTVETYAKGLTQHFGTAPIDLADKAHTGGAKVLFQGSNVTATQAVNDAANSGLTGEEFLGTLPQTMAAQVKALAEGRQAFPTGAGMRSPYWQQRLAAVAQYDPNFDAVNYQARAKTRADFTSGKSSENIKSLNTAIGHMGELDKAIDGLGNTGFPLNNAAAHGIAKITGTDARIAKFESAKIAVANELTKVFRGGPGAEADVQGWLKQLKDDSNPVTLHATVNMMVGLLKSRMDAIGDQYNQGMGTTADPLTLLNPHAAETFRRLENKTQTFDYGGQKVTVVERH